MEIKHPVGGRILTGPFLFFLTLFLIGAYFTTKRFMFGIGAVSNMNDGYPWGIWIALDVVVGTALACGGYTMALLTYACNRMEYHPLVRPALLTSLFGYTLAGASVMIDIGRYWQAYNIILPWHANLHSVMFEVALCIGCYCMVLWIEFVPTVLEKVKADQLLKKLNRYLFVFIALGILLPTMHQSSLGTMMLMAGHKLSPLWRTGFLPLLFLLTALIIGFAVVIYESLYSSVAFKLPPETPILSKLATITFWCLLLFMVIRIEDVNLRGYMPLAFNGSFVSNMFLLENTLLLGALLLLMYPGNRKSPRLLFLAATLLLLGAGLYRFNTYITGFDPGTGWQYFPSAAEIFITLGIVSLEILGYMWCVKKLPILSAHHAPSVSNS
ncbi:MAG: Ni/Fe-hydrogenase cytochrome b subunit [Proteobacteria bacterium]|nr:Ni/Fe-hydrogenase cytochrome b subunit [Desulfobulbaceae bacterium]MBU4152613.1 Ni/Fe-hydrogenase cytochrome b subunit [Pseudomonadota bacterium]